MQDLYHQPQSQQCLIYILAPLPRAVAVIITVEKVCDFDKITAVLATLACVIVVVVSISLAIIIIISRAIIVATLTSIASSLLIILLAQDSWVARV